MRVPNFLINKGSLRFYLFLRMIIDSVIGMATRNIASVRDTSAPIIVDRSVN